MSSEDVKARLLDLERRVANLETIVKVFVDHELRKSKRELEELAEIEVQPDNEPEGGGSIRG